MPRKNEPWFWTARGEWCVKIDGERKRLGKDRQAAFVKFYGLMAARGAGAGENARSADPADVTLAYLFDRVTAFAKANRAATTAYLCKFWLSSLLAYLAKRKGLEAASCLKAEELSPEDLQGWLDASKWSQASKHDAVAVVRRAFNFGIKVIKIIRVNPIDGVEKPEMTSRERVYTDKEFKRILAAVEDENFRDILEVIWLTGCRPQEACRVTASHIQPDSTWVFERVLSKGKKRRRVVFLTPRAKNLSDKWAAKNPNGPIFRNLRGTPWSKDSFNCRFRRLSEALGEKIYVYAFRHSYAHHGLVKGHVSPESMATLLGHKDTRMVYQTYGHLIDDRSFMGAEALRVRGG